MKKLFSIIGVAGALIACQPQDLSTSFKPQPATIDVTFEVQDINGGIDIPSREGETLVIDAIPDNSGKAVMTKTGDKTFTIKGTETYPKIDADTKFDFKLTWTYNTEEDGKKVSKTKEVSKDLKVNGLLAGGYSKYTVKVLLGEAGGFDLRTVEVENGVETKTGDLQPNDNRHAYSHDGYDKWYYNETEYALQLEVSYTLNNGTDVLDGTEVKIEPDFAGIESWKELLKTGMAAYTDDIEVTDTTEALLIGAWCRYKATQTRKIYSKTCELWTVNEKTNQLMQKIGSFDYVEYEDQFDGIDEQGMPGKNWHSGHGHWNPEHAHGPAAQNAGGGIMIAD